MSFVKKARIPGDSPFQSSFTRYVPDKPPTGDFRHMTHREISTHELFQGEKKYNCGRELQNLKVCWETHGADIHSNNYRCDETETIYMGCMEHTDSLNPLGGESSKSFGGEDVFKFMMRASRPVRALSHHPALNTLGDYPAYCGENRNDPMKVVFRTSMRTSKYHRESAAWKKRLNYRKEQCSKGTKLMGR